MTAPSQTNRSPSSRRYSWQEAGWLPITELVVEFAGSDEIRLRGFHGERQLVVCFPVSNVLDLSDPVAALAGAAIHARQTPESAYEVAFMSSDLRPRMVTARPEQERPT